METLLKRGQVVPSFTLPDTTEQPIRRSAYRGKQHLVLVFLPRAHDDASRAYLRALADARPALLAASGEVLAIIRDDVPTTAATKHDLELQFPLLSDADGAVTQRFLPDNVRAGVFVTDRYGELYYSAPAADATALPPISELQDWLTAIDNQCAI
jgi:peroxiredoxin